MFQRLSLRFNTRRSYKSLMRTYVLLAISLRIQCSCVPTEIELCLLMVAYLRGHKLTTLSNFVAAAKKHFECQGILPRNLLHHNVKRGLTQVFGMIDEVIHKVPLRRTHLLILIAYFLKQRQFKLAFAVALNYWAALRISELLNLIWSDFKATLTLTVVIVRKAKNHLRPKSSIISHCQELDALPVLAAQHITVPSNKTRSSTKIFSFGRTHYNQAVKKACRATGLPIGTSHSFRAGFMTDAFAQGHSAQAIAHHTRHQSTKSLSDYNQPDVSDLQKLTVSMLSS